MRLREIREEKGFSQKELAQKIGVSPTNIYNYEVGRTEPSLDMLNIIADVLDVTVDYLIGRTDEETTGVSFQGHVAPSSNVATTGATLSEKEKELLQAFNAQGKKLDNWI